MTAYMKFKIVTTQLNSKYHWFGYRAESLFIAAKNKYIITNYIMFQVDKTQMNSICHLWRTDELG